MGEPPLRLLLIDDESSIREVTKATLEATGNWDVTLAETGEKGIRLAQQLNPHLILIDLMMPEMDGVTAFEKIRDIPATAKTPIAFFTAKATIEEQPHFAEMGIRGVISKPFQPLELSNDLLALLDETERQGS
jgi:CheY-like chemotaxis protein